MTDAQVREATCLRAQGRSYREIGTLLGIGYKRAWYRLNRNGRQKITVKPDTARLWSIDNAVELRTWLAVRGELHVHHEPEKQGQSRWMLVERQTAKCHTPRCLKVRAG